MKTVGKNLAVSLMLPVLLLAAAFLSPAGCEVYYVRGSSGDATPCPPTASPCLTLQEYVDRSSEFLPENMSCVEFRFLSGEHPLSKQFYVRLARNITLRSAKVVPVRGGLDVTVHCTDGVGFVFDSTVGLSIRGMAFSGCGGYGNMSALYFDTCEDLYMQNLEWADLPTQNQTEYAIHAFLLYGKCTMNNIILVQGGLMIMKPTSKQIILTLSNSFIISMDIWDYNDVNVTASHNCSSVTLQNITTNVLFGLQALNVSLKGYACTFNYGIFITTIHSLEITNLSYSGSLSINIELASEEDATLTSQPRISLSNCSFTNNTCYNFLLDIKSGTRTAVEVPVILKNIVFEDNSCPNTPPAILHLRNLANVIMEGVHFTKNWGTPLLLANSTVHMFGENSFTENKAPQGAGVMFISSSLLVLHNESSMFFRDNHAEDVGGAWHVSQLSTSYLEEFAAGRCFLDLHPPDRSNIADLNITVSFVSNSARNGGNVLYGGNIDYCVSSSGMDGYSLLSLENVFSYEPEKDLSRFASAATRVCLCENENPNCLKIFSVLQDIYPGQLFNISVVTVGQRFGVVNGTVYSQLIQFPDKPSSSLEHIQQSQLVGQPECTNLSYVIQSKNHKETISLTATLFGGDGFVNVDQLLLTPVYVNVSLLECPAGFVLSEEPQQCICDPIITRNNLTCDINTGTVQRSGDVWVSYVSSNQSGGQDGVVVSQNCPNGFCIATTQQINVLNPDVQCNFNRSGILCGGCPPNLSIVLGSNRCLSCSNSYIALLIPFAVCGVVLVLFIQMLDLTVAVGTINGLIFYANILQSYDSLFFLTGQRSILTVFVSWLNLDLGIETCFFDGLDSYTKTWLQFAFPLYLWVLAGLIIVLSRYTSRFSANNSVPVLATMILLSYNKLTLTVIVACAFLTLDWPGNDSLALWKYDPNVSFMKTNHSILVLTCVLVFALAWLPYTLMLTFYQCLLHVNHKRGCRWVFKLKPFFDANFGPLKDKHIYWVGVLLLARAVLLLINVSSKSGDGTVISIVIISSLLILHNSFVGHVYKNWLLSLLENSFFLNLIILCIVTSKQSTNQAAAIDTSVSIAFLQFIGIVCFHGYKRASSLYKKCKGRSDYANIEQMETAPTNPTNVTHSEVSIYASVQSCGPQRAPC